MNKRHLALAGACLAATACGYWLARPKIEASHATASAEAITGIPGNLSNNGENSRKSHTEKTSTIKERNAEQLATLKKEIMRSFANSPSPEHDWTLRAQTAAILATLSVDQFKEFVVELLPAKNTGISSEDWRYPLLEQIYQAWGLKDPASASLSQSGGFGFGMSAFNDWLIRDPEAAALFFQQTRQAGETDALAKSMQRSLLNQQALTDLQAANASLPGLDPELRQSILISWTRMFANDPAKRQELVALLTSTSDPKLSETCLKSLIGEFSGRSPSEAAAFVETLAVSEELKDQLSHEVIGEWAKKDPKQAFGAWIERGEARVPAPLLAAMDDWSLNSPGAEESIEWVKGLQAGPVREQFKTHMIGEFSRMDRFSQAAELSMGLEDATERIRQLKLVKRRWDERRADSARAWFSKLPPEDQAAVERALE